MPESFGSKTSTKALPEITHVEQHEKHIEVQNERHSRAGGGYDEEEEEESRPLAAAPA
ncbi:hypothetical protein PHLCEN_2v224 [Hermanssonia centrifuga]|uniref:Uncharacterized protein n=1 Tax=Hermanssonia centrifuga TaxID=98765 RepID=A0A2R6S6N4_9APHY|nr:hypothetical protein PHLCEN_2v224 [Hermanssonia centrifuga]